MNKISRPFHLPLSLYIATAILVSSSLFAVNASADQRLGLRGDINKTITRTTPNGTSTRTLIQQHTETGLARQNKLTTADGRTAERNTIITRDAENKTRTKEVTGTRLNGNTYSGTKVTTRTDSGFVSNATRTNAEGQVATANTVVTMDKESGIATSEKTITNFEGETFTKTKTIQRTAVAESE